MRRSLSILLGFTAIDSRPPPASSRRMLSRFISSAGIRMRRIFFAAATQQPGRKNVTPGAEATCDGTAAHWHTYCFCDASGFRKQPRNSMLSRMFERTPVMKRILLGVAAFAALSARRPLHEHCRSPRTLPRLPRFCRSRLWHVQRLLAARRRPALCGWLLRWLAALSSCLISRIPT